MGSEWFQLCFLTWFGLCLVHDGFEQIPDVKLRVDYDLLPCCLVFLWVQFACCCVLLLSGVVVMCSVPVRLALVPTRALLDVYYGTLALLCLLPLLLFFYRFVHAVGC